VAGICNSVGGSVFVDMPPRCRWCVKARVVNWKQVDVSRSDTPNALGVLIEREKEGFKMVLKG